MDQGRKERELHELYARLPSIECKGRCARECTDTIPCSPAEMEMAAKKWSGSRLPPPPRGDGKCPYLSLDNRCTVHPARPMICRLYGLVRKKPGDDALGEADLQCPWGCVPTRWLTPAEGRWFLLKSQQIGAK